MRSWIPIAAFLFTSFVAVLPARAFEAKPLLGAYLASGGDNLKPEGLSDKSNCFAGNAVGLSAGGILELSNTTPHVFELQLTLGVLVGSGGDGQQATLDFWRYPVDVMSFYHNRKNGFRFGYGVSYQVGNRLTGHDVDQAVSSQFDNAAGFKVATEWLPGLSADGQGFGTGVGLQFTKINYHSQRTDRTYIGDSAMLSASFEIGSH